MLDSCDPLGCRLEATHELGMTHHCPAEDAERDLATDRRLIRTMHLAELSRPDQLTKLIAGHRTVHATRNGRWKPVNTQRREVRGEPAADELVDVNSRVETDDVEPPE